VLGQMGAPAARTTGVDRPSIDVARRRLGGPAGAPSQRAPGSLVRVTPPGGQAAAGVLLWADARHCDVWFEDGVARRSPAAFVAPHQGTAPPALLRVAAEMRLFLSLNEGDSVRWERMTTVVEGRIVEKCRYGAIVAMADGKVVAVGFRKLWPSQASGAA